ncbi:Uncharacterized protein FWK35_00003841 [Aphis craccivora]|uniref:Uncharacterized protein n=1 Tax=Aphis craccivora TaxID=307492 RepID=A0A6G0ZJY2_APHCR|nr:Uncharacterized protein FWK35_00003841 [Aphis craccivora]
MYIPHYVVAAYMEKKVEFLQECGSPETLMNDDIADNGRWTSVAKGQVVSVINNSFHNGNNFFHGHVGGYGERGGHGELTTTPSTNIYSNALDALGRTIKSIVSVSFNIELATQITSPQPPTTSGHVDGHQLCGTRAFGHTWNYCPKNKLF